MPLGQFRESRRCKDVAEEIRLGVGVHLSFQLIHFMTTCLLHWTTNTFQNYVNSLGMKMLLVKQILTMRFESAQKWQSQQQHFGLGLHCSLRPISPIIQNVQVNLNDKMHISYIFNLNKAMFRLYKLCRLESLSLLRTPPTPSNKSSLSIMRNTYQDQNVKDVKTIARISVLIFRTNTFNVNLGHIYYVIFKMRNVQYTLSIKFCVIYFHDTARCLFV